MLKSRTMKKLLAASFAAVAMSGSLARGNSFQVNSGNFSDPASWDLGVPQSGDNADINNGGTATINAGDNLSVNLLRIGLNGGDSGNLVMNGGSLTITGVNGNPDDNAFAVGDQGTGTFTMNNGTITLGSLDPANSDDGLEFHVGKSGSGTMIMNGGLIQMGSTLRVARGQNGNANGVLKILGGEFDTGTGVVVARGANGNSPDGTFVIGGTGKFIAGNSRGEGNANGGYNEGFFSIANNIGAMGHVVVQDSGVVKALRLTGRQGTGDVTIQDNGKFYVVNTLGAFQSGPYGLYNSFLGGGNSSAGDGPDGAFGQYTLTLKGNGLLDVDANPFGRNNDPAPAFSQAANRSELQGFILARGGSTVTAVVQDNATLNVHQRLIIGGMGQGADMTGYNGQPSTDPIFPSGLNPEGTATLTQTGGLVSADAIGIGGTGTGTYSISGGTVRTQAYNQTFDPTANNGAGSATTSTNALRVGWMPGSTGTFKVSGTATVSTDQLVIGHYGNGTMQVTGGAAKISAANVVIQNFSGSQGTLIAEITGATHTTINASQNVTINGGTFQVLPTAVPSTGAHLYTILAANSGGSGSGTLTGRFDTVTLPAADSLGRDWSASYLPTKFEVGLTVPGDTNFDGSVNFTDLLTLAQHYGKAGQWIDGNFNGDSSVDFANLLLLAQHYGSTLSAAQVASLSPAFQADVQRAFAAVPEPSALGLLAVGLVAGVRRRRA